MDRLTKDFSIIRLKKYKEWKRLIDKNKLLKEKKSYKKGKNLLSL